MSVPKLTKTYIELNRQIVDLCEQFAKNCVYTNISKYKSRNQSNIKKIIQDIKIGKIGEFAIFYLLDGSSIPDLQIYSKKNKKFSADLFFDKFNIHVKTQSYNSAKQFGIGWMFQKEDQVIKYAEDNDIFIGLIYYEDLESCVVELICPIKNLKFSNPKISKLTSKIVVELENNL